MKKLITLAALSLMSTAAFAETKTVTFHIEKMNCVTCPVVIKGALNKLEGISEIVTSVKGRSAIVTYDDEKTTVAAMQEATKNVGFPAVVKKEKSE